MPKVSLDAIEKAIRQNCIIDYKATKRLTLKRYVGGRNIGMGRNLFIFFALKAGYRPQAICDYIDMTRDEFKGRHGRLEGFFVEGKKQFEQISGLQDLQSKTEVKDSSLLFYRKMLMIRSSLFTNHHELLI